MESPSNADVVTLQVGNTLRRTDEQKDNGLLLALVDTVTVNRRTATAVSSESNPGGAVQKPRGVDDEKPPTNIALPHDGLAYRFPFDTEKRTYPVFDPIAQKAVRRELRRRRRRQWLDDLPVQPERRLYCVFIPLFKEISLLKHQQLFCDLLHHADRKP